MSNNMMESKRTMYKIDPIYSFDSNFTLPTCMYRVENIHGRNECEGVVANDPTLENSTVLQQKPLDITKMIEERQRKLLEQLENLRLQMLAMKQNMTSTSEQNTNQSQEKSDLSKDIVISTDPKNPPYYLLVLQKLLNIKISCHVHSSVVELPEVTREFVKMVEARNPVQHALNIVLIWKSVEVSTKLVSSPAMPVVLCGDVNVMRYLVCAMPSSLSYQSWEIDSVLDICHRLKWLGASKERQSLLQQLNDKFRKSQWLCDSKNYSIGDVAAWSTIKQGGFMNDLPGNMKGWFKKCDNTFA